MSPGGPATANGILYQILGCLEWAGRLSFGTTADNGASLVIEPRDGGDIQIGSRHGRRVEQWKTKSGDGTWSFATIVAEVLPDLYRAVRTNEWADSDVFAFKTDARKGNWTVADDFLAGLRSLKIVEGMVSNQLDDSKPLPFPHSEPSTQRAMFVTICKTIRSSPEFSLEEWSHTQRKVLHLLTHFQIEDRQSADHLAVEIERHLASVVDYNGEITSKRRELTGIILELAAKGAIVASPRELFRMAGLTAISLQDLALPRCALQDRLSFKLKHVGYDAATDVRPAQRIDDGSAIAIVVGESGQGKTWRLASAAVAAATTSVLVVWVNARDNDADFVRAAADELWLRALGHDRPLDLLSIATRHASLNPGAGHWLTVFVDDVRMATQLGALTQEDWPRYGIHFALTAPEAFVAPRRSQVQRIARIHELGDFTQPDVHEYLRRRQRDWTALSSAVREILRRPLLAQLYCDTTPPGPGADTNEFQLCRSYWERLRTQQTQPEHRGDASLMRTLVQSLFDDTVPYPWPRSHLIALGIGNEAERRLQSIGWLHDTGEDEVEVWHDRVLNWAVAESLADARRNSVLTQNDLCIRVSRTVGASFRTHRLGYVFADVLWIIAYREEYRDLRSDLSRIIESVDETLALFHDQIYKSVLPAVGPGIIPAVVERLRRLSGNLVLMYPCIVSECIADIAEASATPPDATVVSMLNDDHQHVRETGLMVFRRHPVAAALDRVWELHTKCIEGMSDTNDHLRYTRHQRSRAAVDAGVAMWPEWLEAKIKRGPQSDDPTWELVYILACTKKGADIWRQNKLALIRNVPEGRRHAIVRCILEHFDGDETALLLNWASHGASYAIDAFAALCTLSPDTALDCLSFLPAGALFSNRGIWVQELHVRRPQQAADVLRRRMVADAPNAWLLAHCYDGYDDLVEPELLSQFLAMLDRTVTESASAQDPGAVADPLFRHLGLLAGVHSEACLEAFRSRSGSSLEYHLSQLAVNWAGIGSTAAHLACEAALSVLLKIGGVGFTKLINAYLNADGCGANFTGLEYASVLPDSETIRRLIDIFRSDELSPGAPERAYPYAQMAATQALAELGRWDAVIESVLKWGDKGVILQLALICREAAPLPAGAFQIARAALDSTSPLQLNAVIALGLSGRSEYSPDLLAICRNAAPDSEIAIASLLALASVRSTGPEFIDLARNQLGIPAHRTKAVFALERADSAVARDVLEEALIKLGKTGFGRLFWGLASSLCTDPARKARLLPLVSAAALDDNDVLASMEAFHLLGASTSSQIDDYLWEHIYAREEGIHFVGRQASAIRAAAQQRPEDAYTSGIAALSDRSAKDRHLLPDLLLAISVDRATTDLLDQYVKEMSVRIRLAIAVALRLRGTKSVVASRVSVLLSSGHRKDRIAGIELSGWLGHGYQASTLTEIATTSPDRAQRESALEALGRQRREAQAVPLISQLAATNSVIFKWCLSKSILSLVAPELLFVESDPLGLLAATRKCPVSLRFHLNQEGKRRLEASAKIADELDRKSRDE